MISIRKSVSELEYLEELRQQLRKGYSNAIRAAAEYAIELDPHQAAELRRNLESIRENLEHASAPDDYQSVESSLRGELRLYRDRSNERLEKIAYDLQASALAMQTLAGNLAVNGTDHETRLASELRALASAAKSDDLIHIKKVTHAAVSSINESWELLRKANQLVIAQLHDEIQALHREIDNERRAMYTDAASGAWNRKKMDQRIDDNLSGDEAFCVVMAGVTNLRRLSATYSRRLIDGALQALVKRIQKAAGKDTMIGRWSEDQIAILLELNPDQAPALSSEIAKELSGPFSIQENGVARTLTLRVSTSIVGRPRGGDAGQFRKKLAMLDGAS